MRKTGTPGISANRSRPDADDPGGAHPRPLRELAQAGAASMPRGVDGEILIRAITDDSQVVRPGSLFVALSGTRTDGHAFAREAQERGAIAVVAEPPCPEGIGIPCLRVDDARKALARMAAAWHGRPADRLRLAGITGTVGKTSVLAMMEAVLRESGVPVGAIGSLGVSVEGDAEPTGYTAPDPLLLHEGLARIERSGAGLVVMEVTSHALVQERVHGLELALGVFTNLLPLEHAEFHPTFRAYVEAKCRFFEHLPPGRPIVYAYDDLAVRRVVRERALKPVGCGVGQRASVRLEDLSIALDGTRFTLNYRRPLPRVDAAPLAPFRLPLRLRPMGRANAINAALAATAALSLGADPQAAARALAAIPPPRRRLELIHDGAFRVLDDTVGHPDSVSALFEVVAALTARRLHAVFGIRGKRGATINRRMAEALVVWLERHPLETLVITRSADAADERNVVSARERAAFLAPLREAGVRFEERETLDDAVPLALQRAGDGDLVMLLGAQGMDGAADRTRKWLRENS
jgi:UDP-N-acetylmuramoyl-L-alanyl-D-glutamate--2,6-diaminopimelate ligase